MDKTVLLASFIHPEKLESFKAYLATDFDIKEGKIFGYKNLSDDKIITTFKLCIKDGQHLNLRDIFPNTLIIHKKGDALYTINALNELILAKINGDIGNVDTKSIKIDWSEYQNKFILLDKKKLTFLDIKRIF